MGLDYGRTMQIRPCTTEDLERVRAIYAEHVRAGTGSFEEVPPESSEIERRFVAVTSRGFPFYVGELAGSVAGFAYAGPYHTRSAYRFTCEDSVYVEPAAQRRGLGRALLSAVIDGAARLGQKQMVALVGDAENAGSIALHRALGFRRAGALTAVGLKHGRWLDVVLMQRALGA